MSHWAEIDENNIVLRVLVGDNNESDEGEAFMNSLGGTWVKTSYNGNIRYNYAGIGYTYDASYGEDGAFIPPQPYPSWKLSNVDASWKAPVAYPTDGVVYEWDETITDWKATVND
jgi:hypothetical protein